MSKSRIDELSSEIIKHRRLYYNDTPSISDAAFDLIFDELRFLDPTNIAITSIGAPVEDHSEWEKGKHNLPMGSLDKAKTPDELAKWVNDTFTNSNSLFIVEKLDGSSIEVIYENGKMVEALTRGSGLIGEKIGRNVAKMNGVKTTLPIPFTGSLRGEIILKKSNLKYFPDIVSARNGANGIAKRLSGEGSEYLDIMFYQAVGNENFASEMLQLNFIKDELKLNAPNYDALAAKDINTLIDFVVAKWNEYQLRIRQSLDYEIDGLVVRVNDLRRQEELGQKHLKPCGAVAFKFPSPEAKTKVLDIRPSLGNGGRITPVVYFEPVILGDAKIENANIYNFGYIQEMGLDVGAEVIVKRGGDVIPLISEVVISTGTIFKTPDCCPVCFGPVEQRGEYLQCANTDSCFGQSQGRIRNWANGLNILELGDTLIEKLVETKLVSNVVDLYKLSIDDLAGLERMGKKSATNVHKSLWSHNPIPLNMFLGSLSIPMVGQSTIDILIEAGYDSLDKIMKMSYDNIVVIKGLGPVKSKSLIEGLERNKSIIGELLEMGLYIEEVKVVNKSGGKLEGFSFVLTGTMVNKRKDLEQMIEDNGGTVQNKVSKNTTYLIIAYTNSHSSKAVSARNLGIKIISEDDFINMI